MMVQSRFHNDDDGDLHQQILRNENDIEELESWSRKSVQDDKWSFCLTAGTLWPANQERQ